MTRVKLRSERQVIERCRALRSDLQAATAQLPSQDAAVVDAVWRGEALGTLLWALQLAELPRTTSRSTREAVAAVDPAGGELRDAEEIDLERESARLWHWRARTTGLHAAGALELPPRYASFDQLIAATAMRGHDAGATAGADARRLPGLRQGLPPPLSRAACARHIRSPSERHHALDWLTGAGATWDDVPLDT